MLPPRTAVKMQDLVSVHGTAPALNHTPVRASSLWSHLIACDYDAQYPKAGVIN